MAVLAVHIPGDTDIVRRLRVLRRQIEEARASITIHMTLHDVVGASPKTSHGMVDKAVDQAFRAISNATLNNVIVMTHQIFDGTKPAYSLKHAKGDQTLCKTNEDTDRLKCLFKDHNGTIEKLQKFRNSVAAHASFDKDAMGIVKDIDLDIWAVKCMLKAAAECVEGLFLANPVVGMPLPDFNQADETLEKQLKDVFGKGFG
jgi:flavin-binding protein dodecin